MAGANTQRPMPSPSASEVVESSDSLSLPPSPGSSLLTTQAPLPNGHHDDDDDNDVASTKSGKSTMDVTDERFQHLTPEECRNSRSTAAVVFANEVRQHSLQMMDDLSDAESKIAHSETSESSSCSLQKRHITTKASTMRQCVDQVSDVCSFWTKEILDRVLLRDMNSYYRHLMQVATNYDQWAAAGGMLDKLTGKDRWRDDPVSKEYDYQLIQERLQQLRKARQSGDMRAMMFILRSSLSRNIGDIGNPRLYGYTYVGTKHLIEDYIDELIRQLHIICELESSTVSPDEKYDFFINTQKAFGRTALCLSGGGSLALCHIGVCKALYESNLLPRVISGSSGGSIVAAVLSTRTDEELVRAFDPRNINLNFFENPESRKAGTAAKLHNFVQDGVVYDIEILREAVRDNIGDITFQEAFNKTRRILNITVSSSTVYEMPRLLNYLTAPNVLIWSAVAASCSVPFVYSSSPLLTKGADGYKPWNPSGHRWIDGSVEGDLPMTRISEMFNVNHFIVCQVNPHVVPFMSNDPSPSLISRAVQGVASLVRSEVHHRLTQISELGATSPLLYRLRTVISQKYYGDITIVPTLRIMDYARVLGNPDPERAIYFSNLGERATWPQMSILSNHCKIELCLDEILYRTRLRKLVRQRTPLTGIHVNEFDLRSLGPLTAPLPEGKPLPFSLQGASEETDIDGDQDGSWAKRERSDPVKPSRRDYFS